MQVKRSINVQTLVILTVLFAFYVAGDLMTTVWLINRYPGGIEGESNPLGVMLYAGHGIVGLIISKVIVFVAVSVGTIVIEYRYGNSAKMRTVSSLVILGLMAWSIIIVTNNLLVVYLLSLQQGTQESSFLLRLYILLFSITLAGLIGLPMLIRRSLRVVQAMLAAAIILSPLAFSPKIYEFLIVQNILNLIIYVVSMIGITALMLYSTERLYKLVRTK